VALGLPADRVPCLLGAEGLVLAAETDMVNVTAERTPYVMGIQRAVYFPGCKKTRPGLLVVPAGLTIVKTMPAIRVHVLGDLQYPVTASVAADARHARAL